MKQFYYKTILGNFKPIKILDTITEDSIKVGGEQVEKIKRIIKYKVVILNNKKIKYINPNRIYEGNTKDENKNEVKVNDIKKVKK